MKAAIISFSRAGAKQCQKLKSYFTEQNWIAEGYCPERFVLEFQLKPYVAPLSEWVSSKWRYDCIIMIGAVGIAVRGIAPLVKDKREDPAVVVIDDKAQYVIPLLSGHIGGANQIAERIAREIGAIPIITTATDIWERFAVDTFAAKNNLYISDKEMAKKISAEILEGKKVGLFSEFELQGEIPEQLSFEKKQQLNIYIGIHTVERRSTLQLVPKCASLGLGCKKGSPVHNIEAAVIHMLEEHQISRYCLKEAASIDLKKEEPGIMEFCRINNLPYITYEKECLEQARGAFTESVFVAEITGVGNVCERAAVTASGGELLAEKTVLNGVTAALAVTRRRIIFE